MNISLLFLSGLLATTLMTGFSYLMAHIKDSQFREPVLLNILLQRAPGIPVKIHKNHYLGWIIHYAIGWIFAICFDITWNSNLMDPTWASGCYLGYIAGIIGISGWGIFFKLSPNPPLIEFRKFYLQLIVAHIIFGMGAVLVYVLW